jgi:hypothetical protein
MTQLSDHQSDPAGWAIPDWCAEAGISRTAEHMLPGDMKPRSVKIGRRRIIIEPPRDWLLRIEAAQRAPA